jgi:hypothetical protein
VCRGYLVGAVIFAKESVMPWLLYTVAGRSVLTGAVILAAFFGWLHNHDKKVVSRVVAKIEEKANANAEKADAARKSVDDLPADRLRSSTSFGSSASR